MSFAPGPVETAAFMAAQAARTAPMRRHLYRKASLARRSRVLDVGCGTGGVTAEIAAATAGGVVGVDRDAGLLEYAASACGTAEFVQADCERLPFPDGAFDMVTCHFFLMWARDAGAAVREMVRVLEPGGVLLAAAEPDYGGLVEYPEHPEYSGSVKRGLLLRGADPLAGRKLGSLFRSAGLGTRTGVSATPWEGDVLSREYASRAEWIRADLELVLGPDRAEEVFERELRYAAGGKTVMVPLYWAMGAKPLPGGVD